MFLTPIFFLDVDAISSASTPDNISLIAKQVVEKIRLKCKIIPVNKVAVSKILSDDAVSQIQFNKNNHGPGNGRWNRLLKEAEYGQ